MSRLQKTNIYSVLFVVMFAVLGAYLTWVTHAATPTNTSTVVNGASLASCSTNPCTTGTYDASVLNNTACGANPAILAGNVVQLGAINDGHSNENYCYSWYKPANINSTPAATVVIFEHCAGSACTGSPLRLGWQYLADHNALNIVVAINSRTNVGNGAWIHPLIDYPAPTTCPNVVAPAVQTAPTCSDNPFIKALVTDIETGMGATKIKVDPQRVYAAGASSGGTEMIDIACTPEQSLFRGVSIVSAHVQLAQSSTTNGHEVPGTENCPTNPNHPFFVISQHGTNDTSVPFNGSCNFGVNDHCVASDTENRRYLAAHLGCSATPTDTKFGSPSALNILHTYSNCSFGLTPAYESTTVQNGGHTDCALNDVSQLPAKFCGGSTVTNTNGYFTAGEAWNFWASSQWNTATTTTPPTVSIAASPTTITAGQTSTLTWSSSNANSCTASGAWTGTKATSGSASSGTLSTAGTDTFTLSCSGNGGTAQASATVTVNPGGSGGGGGSAGPTATFTAPASNATVSGTVTASATVTDSNPVTSVQFKVDSNNIGTALPGSNTNIYVTKWDSSTISNGAHTLSVVVTDSVSKQATATVSINTNNTPSSGGGGAAAGGDGTVGSLLFQMDFVHPKSAIVNTYGTNPNPQAGNTGQASTYFNGQGKWYGDGVSAHSSLYTQYLPLNGVALPALGGVTNYANLVNPVPPNPGCPDSAGVVDQIHCSHEASNYVAPRQPTNNLGKTTYESYAFYVPPGGLPPLANGQNNELALMEWPWSNACQNAQCVSLRLTNDDHITVLLSSGLYGGNQAGSTAQNGTSAYHSDVDAYPNHPTGSTLVPASSSQISDFYAIPPGHITNGAWNEIICKINWEMTATGGFTCWYRAAGNNWTQSASYSGIPTLGYPSGGQPPIPHNEGPQLYGSSVTQPFNLNVAGVTDATGFAAAANAMPGGNTNTGGGGGTTNPTPPSTPSGLQSTGTTSTTASLAWTASTAGSNSLSGYYVVRNGVTIGQTQSAAFTDSTVQSGQTYSYQVMAYDSTGNTSGLSASISVTIPGSGGGGTGSGGGGTGPTAPSAPTNLAGQAISDTQINLSWTASTSASGVSGYYVYRGSSKIATVTTTTFGDSNLAASTNYSYHIVAYNSAGSSPSSNTVTVATQAVPTPPEVKTGTVTGTVKTGRGNPNPGVTVSYTYNSTTHTATTNSLGKYTLYNVPAAKITFHFSKLGLTPKSVTATVQANTTITVNATLSDNKK